MKLGIKSKNGNDSMRQVLKPRKPVGSKSTKKLLNHEIKRGMQNTLKPKKQRTLLELWGPESVIEGNSETTQKSDEKGEENARNTDNFRRFLTDNAAT